MRNCITMRNIVNILDDNTFHDCLCTQSNCVFCGFESSKQETVEAHANKQHIGRQLKCPDCSFESYYKTNLQVHIKKVHGRKAENCIVPGCKFRSLFTSKIQVHLFSKHHGYYDEERHSIMVPLK